MRQGDRGSRSSLVRYIAHARVCGALREMGFHKNLDGILKRPMNLPPTTTSDIDMPRRSERQKKDRHGLSRKCDTQRYGGDSLAPWRL